MQNNNIILIMPEILIFITILICLISSIINNKYINIKIVHVFIAITTFIAGCTAIFLLKEQYSFNLLFNKTYLIDNLSSLIKAIMCFSFTMTLIYSFHHIIANNLLKIEFYLLSMLALLGQMLMTSGNNFITLYLSLELMSLSLYAIIAIQYRNINATESALKYYILSILASGFLLYGFSIIYGITGSLQIEDISNNILYIKHINEHSKIIILGIIFIIIGITFKLGVVPFHIWLPDVYEGTPTVITLLISIGPKIAAFGFAFRILINGLLPLATNWQIILIISAILSIIIGNLLGIVQSNIKRMIAYSAIAHQGFVLLGLLSGVFQGNNTHDIINAYSLALFYIIIYLFTTIGVFGLLIILSQKNNITKLNDLKGLNKQCPLIAFTMLIIMFSFAGIPPFIGFYTKFSILSAVVNAKLTWLAIITIFSSLIGVFYYLRIIKIMYFDVSTETFLINKKCMLNNILLVHSLLILILGFFPDFLLNICSQVIQYSIKL